MQVIQGFKSFYKLKFSCDDWACLAPVLTIISITLYYKYNITFSFYGLIFISISCFILTFFSYNKIISSIACALLFFASGSLSCEFRERSLNLTTIRQKTINQEVCGVVLQISKGDKYKIIIEPSDQNGKIQFKIDPKFYNYSMKAGDQVCFVADLYQLPKGIYPNAYNFSDVAKYNKIIGLGNITSNIKIEREKKQNNTAILFENIRHKIDVIIAKNIGRNQETGVQMALFTANKGYLSQETIDDVKKSGLSHLLAISGLHISIIAMTSFLIIRRLLALNFYLATRYDIKKIAAVMALMISFFHLQISSAPLSAIRSFIMFSFVICGILMDRSASSQRFLSAAFFIMMMFTPESVFNPSLQMSFMAVLSLIAGFLSITKKFNLEEAGRFKKSVVYSFGVFLASVLSTIGTTPHTIYHFNQFSISGLISNIIAVPIIEFISIPFGVIGLFFSFIGLEYPFFYIAKLGNTLFLVVAHYFADFKYSNIIIPEIPAVAFFWYNISLIFLFFLRSYLRYIFCLFFLLIAIFYTVTHKKTDIIITRDGLIFKAENGRYFSSTPMKSQFANMIYAGKIGQESIEQIPDSERAKYFTKSQKFTLYSDLKYVIYEISPEFTASDCDKIEYIHYKKNFVLDRRNLYREHCQKRRGLRLVNNNLFFTQGCVVVKG